jgi:hypothetical protein
LFFTILTHKILLPFSFWFRLEKFQGRVKWARHVACMGGMRDAYRLFVGKTDWKRPLRRYRHRWEGNIKLDHTGCEGVD